MTNPLRIIALTGPKTCGKDTAAKGLFIQNDKLPRMQYFRHAQMAAYAKFIAAYAFGYDPQLNELTDMKEVPLPTWPGICPRQLVIDVANWYRDQYGGSVWARRWEQEALQYPDWGAHVMTDCRFPEELDMLRRHNSLLIYVERDAAEDALRLKQQGGDVLATNVSESHYKFLREQADVVVQNNKEIHHLHAEIQSVVANRFGHWSQWDNSRPVVDPVTRVRTRDMHFVNGEAK